MRKIKLRTKLLAGFLFVSLVNVAIGIFGIAKLQEMQDAGTSIYAHVTIPLAKITDIAETFQLLRINLRDVLEARDPAVVEKSHRAVDELQNAITIKMTAFGKNLSTKNERENFGKMQRAGHNYVANVLEILDLDSAFKEDEAKAVLAGPARAAALEYQRQLDSLVRSLKLRGRRQEARNAATLRSTEIFFYSLILTGLALSLGLGLLITRSIMRQLGEDPAYLATVAGRIAGGDLGVVFRPQKRQRGVYHVMQGMVKTMRDKIGEAEQKTAEAARQAQLARAAGQEAHEARKAAERARKEGMIAAARQLEDVAQGVSEAGAKLSAQVEQSSGRAEAQAGRLGETAAAMEKMNSTVLEVAKNASQAAKSTQNARGKANEGARIVRRVVDGIGVMQNMSRELKADMENLGRQAEGIGQVMGVISDIADQTNLLALNAAIEAARAGDAGRGFAVVADEVRKLAEKTMAATKEVGAAVDGIQQSARKNLQSMEDSARAVEQATTLADTSEEALREIVRMVDGATGQVNSIATASDEQSATSEEINKSIEEINRISGETAEAMRQSAHAVDDLEVQTKRLRELIEEMHQGGAKTASAE